MMQLAEPFVVQDVYVSDLADLEEIGDGNYRFTFTTRQRSSYDGASMDNVVVCRLVAPTSAIIAAVKMTMQKLGMRCCGAVRSMVH